MENIVDVLDVNYPLMVLLRSKAPGTYSHSKNVASMLKSLAGPLGLNAELLDICGHFHDIGKTVSPRFFSENQTDDDKNPHDLLEPWMSYKLISAHVGDTTQILINDPNIPRKAIEICSQHHGTCIMKFFLMKSETGNDENYRYKATRPQSLEAAILIICDQIDATSRSLDQAGKLKDIDGLVEKTISELIDDGQLDEVEFTFGKFRIIKKILKQELASQFHKRVDYDDAIMNKEEEVIDDATKPRKRKITQPHSELEIIS